MSALTIDTLAVAQILQKRGFSEEQATGVVEAIRAIDGSRLATKSDLKEAIAEFKVDMVRWLFVTQTALGGFICAAMEFAK